MTRLEYDCRQLVSLSRRIRDSLEYREHLASTSGRATWLDVDLASVKHAIDRAKAAVDALVAEADANTREMVS